MIRQTFYIALNDVTTTFRYRSTLIFALLMPLAFTLVLGTVIGGGSGNDPAPRWALGVADEDGGALGQAVKQRLGAVRELDVRTVDAAAGMEAIRRDELTALLLVPAGFTDAVRQGRPPEINLLVSGSDARGDQSVEQAVRAALSETYGIARSVQIALDARTALDRANLAAGAGASGRQTWASAPTFTERVAASEALWAGVRPVTVAAQAVTPTKSAAVQPAGGFDQSSPGMLVTFGLVFMLNGATVLVAEREQGTLRRLLVLPLRKAGILGGKLSGIWAAGVAQALLLITAGALAFKVDWGRSPAALAVMVLAFGFSIASMGMMIAALSRTYAQANALTNILMYSVAALGGAWWPVEITPAWMQSAAHGVPTYWAMQGFENIITRGLGVQAILPQAGALLAFGAAFLAIGVWRFRYE